jgi:peptide/nickel transport system permease protein
MAVTTDVLVSSAPPADEATTARPRAWRRSLAIGAPATLIALVFFACFVLPLVAPIPEPTGGDILESLQPNFSPGHLLGTDPDGNDILSRILHGGRSSLIIALSVQVIGLVIGGSLGALAGVARTVLDGIAGSIVDGIIMRLMDVLIAVPSLILVIVVSQALGPGVRNTIFALAFLSIPTFGRIARAETLRLREQPFMVAARLSGTSMWRILTRHLAPNIRPQLMTTALLGMGIVIIIEGALSFLGGGIEPPAPSWGNMIFQGYLSLSGTPWLVVWPSVMLTLTVVGFNGLGEALRARWSSR